MIRNKMIWMLLVAAVATIYSTSATAGSFGWDNCIVDSNKKNYSTYSIQNAISEFNSSDPAKWCSKKITVQIIDKTKTIYLSRPLIISGKQAYGINDPFIFEAKDGEDRIMLKADEGVTIEDLAKADGCLVLIEADYITMQNFQVVGSPGDGLCISGKNITLKDMEIRDNTGAGIRLIGSGGTAMAFGVENTQVYNNDLTGLLIESGAGALIDVGEKMTFFQNGGTEFTKASSMVSSTSPVYIQVTLNRRTGKKFTVQGYVRKGDACDAEIDDSIEQIYVHRADQQSGATYLDTIELKKDVVDEKNETGGQIKKIGYFKFDYDGDARQIFFIPALAGNVIGSSSRIYTLSQGASGGEVDCGVTGVGGGGGDDYESTITNIVGFATKSDCKNYNQLYGIGEGVEAPLQFDSDNDGIPDYREDVNNNCECDPGELCWFRADTDFDGIKDGIEDKDADGTDCVKVSSGEKIEPLDKKTVYADIPDVTLSSSFAPGSRVATECVEKVVGGKALLKTGYSLIETDVALQYTDEDGKTDGEETRSRGFNKGAKTYLYTDNETTLFKPDAEKHECEIPSEASLAGIYYGIFKVSADGKTITDVTGQPDVVTAENDYFMFLVCKNPSIKLGRDYVGTEWNKNNKWGMTDPLDKDTDDDGWDDFEDQCPLTTDTETRFCTPECVDYEIFNYIPEIYVNSNYESLADVDGNGKKDIFEIPVSEVSLKLCGDEYNCDIDKDGIIDIFENPEGKCNAPGMSSPYKVNSDEDDTPDNQDVCPGYKGVQEFAGCNSAQDIQSVYKQRPYLACFIDRDNDKLYDCQEDLNLNGIYDKDGGKDTTDPFSVKHTYGESDASKKDTDGELDDYLEVVILGTHPGELDTDGDKLADKGEVGIDGDETTYKTVTLGSYIAKDGVCWTTLTDIGDTNPLVPDTDEDGISDGIEITNMVTNPNNKDSDGDGLSDKDEDTNTNGKWAIFENGKLKTDGVSEEDYFDSNPCDSNTDHEGMGDAEEIANGTCPNNDNTGCKYKGKGDYKYGYDSDADGMPDNVEVSPEWNTDPNDSDTDDDGLLDGCDSSGKFGELCWHVETGNWEFNGINTDEGESNPGIKGDDDCGNIGRDTVTLKDIYKNEGAESFCNVQIGIACGSDSDGDLLPDYYEKLLGTKPNNGDTDRDGIGDGFEMKWVIVSEEVGGMGSGIFKLMTQKGADAYVSGSMTNPLDADSDIDGLVDGFINKTNYEDFNCNGKVDVDTAGHAKETDPTTENSNGTGGNDKEDSFKNGWFSPNAAIVPELGGCANIGGAGGETWGMTLMFAMLLISTRVAVFVMRKTKKIKARR